MGIWKNDYMPSSNARRAVDRVFKRMNPNKISIRRTEDKLLKDMGVNMRNADERYSDKIAGEYEYGSAGRYTLTADMFTVTCRKVGIECPTG